MWIFYKKIIVHKKIYNFNIKVIILWYIFIFIQSEFDGICQNIAIIAGYHLVTSGIRIVCSENKNSGINIFDNAIVYNISFSAFYTSEHNFFAEIFFEHFFDCFYSFHTTVTSKILFTLQTKNILCVYYRKFNRK